MTSIAYIGTSYRQPARHICDDFCSFLLSLTRMSLFMDFILMYSAFISAMQLLSAPRAASLSGLISNTLLYILQASSYSKTCRHTQPGELCVLDLSGCGRGRPQADCPSYSRASCPRGYRAALLMSRYACCGPHTPSPRERERERERERKLGRLSSEPWLGICWTHRAHWLPLFLPPALHCSYSRPHLHHALKECMCLSRNITVC